MKISILLIVSACSFVAIQNGVAQVQTSNPVLQGSVPFKSYLEVVRLRNNGKKSLPDLNLGGWQIYKWGDVLPKIEINSISEDILLYGSTRPKFIHNAEKKLQALYWALPKDISIFNDIEEKLIARYGYPSEHHSNGMRVWRGYASKISLLSTELGTNLTLSSVSQ